MDLHVDRVSNAEFAKSKEANLFRFLDLKRTAAVLQEVDVQAWTGMSYMFQNLQKYGMCLKGYINWRDVQRRNVVNNVDRSSLRAHW